MKNNIIFDLSNPNHKYKGVLFAELDNETNCKEFGFPPPPLNYCVGVMAIIWVDEKGVWHGKTRIKFPSGNKQVLTKEYGEKSSETIILQEIYKMNLKHKKWTRNPSETGVGILEIIEKLDMIESIKFIKGDE